MTAIDLLGEIIALRSKATAATYLHRPEFEALARRGLVREIGTVQSMVCLECDVTHDAEIIHDGGHYGYYCPDLGFTAVERDEIRGLLPDFPSIVSGLADAFNCRRRKSTPLQHQTWRIGTTACEAGDITLYFHPSLLDEQDATELSMALSRDIKSTFRVVLTGAGALPIPSVETVLLADVVEFDTTQAAFSVLVDPRVLVDAPRKNLGGAPNRFKDLLAPLILKRIENGAAVKGRNAEARALLETFCHEHPEIKPPSLSRVQDYVTEFRTGQ